MFYAIEWTYGRATVDLTTGGRCGKYYAFATKADRDAWAEDNDNREAISASDKELRSCLRHDKKIGRDELVSMDWKHYIYQVNAMEEYHKEEAKKEAKELKEWEEQENRRQSEELAKWEKEERRREEEILRSH